MTQKQILGQELENDGNGKLVMSQSQVNAAMDELGATKEIREKYQKAEQKLMGEAVKAAGAEVCENPEIGKVQIRLGRGDGSKRVTVTGQKKFNVSDPRTGETKQHTQYGHVKVDEKRIFSKEVRDNEVTNVEEDCERVFSQR